MGGGGFGAHAMTLKVVTTWDWLSTVTLISVPSRSTLDSVFETPTHGISMFLLSGVQSASRTREPGRLADGFRRYLRKQET